MVCVGVGQPRRQTAPPVPLGTGTGTGTTSRARVAPTKAGAAARASRIALACIAVSRRRCGQDDGGAALQTNEAYAIDNRKFRAGPCAAQCTLDAHTAALGPNASTQNKTFGPRSVPESKSQSLTLSHLTALLSSFLYL